MSGHFAVIVERSVLREAKRIPLMFWKTILDRIYSLAENPFPPGVTKIQGYPRWYRIRVGDYRVIYEVATTIRIVTIMRVGHRKNVYRFL